MNTDESLLGKRPYPNKGNSENNNNNVPANGFSMMLRRNANIRNPSAKRPRMNTAAIPPAPEQGPVLMRQNAIAPGAPRKAPRPSTPPFIGPSALKGTNPKNRSRRISHTSMAPVVTTYELRNNADPMTHMNSQTNRTFERYIVPCLRENISDEEIQELYDMYVSLKTDRRGKLPNRPDITKESAIIAHVNGIIYNHLASINALNIGQNTTKNVPPEFGALPEQQRIDIFRNIGADISSTYEDRESDVTVARIIMYALGKFRRYLPAGFVAQVNEYLNKQIMPTTGGKHNSSRNKTQRRNKTKRKRSTRSSRKN
jgi:hypothetical protein